MTKKSLYWVTTSNKHYYAQDVILKPIWNVYFLKHVWQPRGDFISYNRTENGLNFEHAEMPNEKRLKKVIRFYYILITSSIVLIQLMSIL